VKWWTKDDQRWGGGTFLAGASECNNGGNSAEFYLELHKKDGVPKGTLISLEGELVDHST